MKSKNLLIYGLLICVTFSCTQFDTRKFDFHVSPDKFAPHIKLAENQDIRIVLGNIYASYPDNRYEYGINTQLSFYNLGAKEITIDTIHVNQFFDDFNISDSVRVWLDPQARKTFPIKLCPESEGFPCNGIRLNYFIDNSKHDFQIGDTIRVETNLSFRIGEKHKQISRIDKKVYRRLQGYYSP